MEYSLYNNLIIYDEIEEQDDKINEVRFVDILRKSKDAKAPIAKVYDIQARFAGIDVDQFIITFYTQDFGPQGSNRIHTTQFQVNKREDGKKWKTAMNLYLIKDNVPALRAFILNGFIKHGYTNYWCSCESFQFHGFNYMAYKNKSNILPHVEKRFPKKTNPNLRGICCKHVASLVANITTFTDTILGGLQRQLKRKGGPGTGVGPTTGKETPTVTNSPSPATNPQAPHPKGPKPPEKTPPSEIGSPTDLTSVAQNPEGEVDHEEPMTTDNAKQFQHKLKHHHKKHHWIKLHTDLNNLDVQKWLDNIYKRYHGHERSDEQALDHSQIARILRHHK